MMKKLTCKSHDNHHEHVDSLKADVEVEVGVVLYTDAVVDPLTMMIKSLNTCIADVAMTRVCSTNNFTGWAKHIRVKLLN